jgi:drug/metabolite transporter (DMT)-like permease
MKNRSNERLGFVFLITAIGLWSTVEVVVRSVHQAIPPIQFAWIRFLFGGAFLAFLFPLELRRRGLRLNRSIIVFAAWSSLPGVAVSAVALQFGLTLSGAAVVATVYGAAPLVVMGLSRALLGDPMTPARVVGLVGGFLGILLLAMGKPSPTFSLPGVACALLSVCSFCLWAVLVKRSAGPYAGLPVTVLSFFFGVLFMTPFMLWEGGGLAVAPLLDHAGPVLYLSIGTTGLAYWLYFMGLERIDATRAMSMILLKPPIAAVLAMAVLGEPLTWNLALSMALILSALYGVMIWDRRKIGISAENRQQRKIAKENVPCPNQKSV